LKKQLSEAEAAQAPATQPTRLQLKTLEEEAKRLKKELAQKDVELRLSQKDLEVKMLRQQLIEAESQGIAAEKISSENSNLREALEKVHKICGDALVEKEMF
jgi:hypothetical protein